MKISTKNKKVFIDFGPGDMLKYLKKARFQGFYTIAINQEEYEEMNSEYWKLIVDETHIGKFSDEFDIPKADLWHCTSVLEHMKEDEIHKELQGLKRKIKKTSSGKIHIDLTDHEGGFRHYEEEDFGRTYPVFYLNRIKHDEWWGILNKYFYITENFDYLDKGKVHWKEFEVYAENNEKK
ncbi:uncharacterized protein METZ01_LOCUS220090 [marine metagenome]|uniref:Methyltransferase type 11 domain-containing protein n=1 Tax=marine metagenome TaxID=408172 RepID=A0A382FVW5_9ZZZZ